ncbi:L-rhamnose mutarotase [Streptomyces sp. NPDC004629]|uniref:L-rhamnose mutarotase n=1 Tax=Streptomyces sp. NPDC004629 TaxID=3364705 RepID=UPI00368BA443
MDIMIDANQSMTYAEARRRAAVFEPLDLVWFEEPLPASGSWGGVRRAENARERERGDLSPSEFHRTGHFRRSSTSWSRKGSESPVQRYGMVIEVRAEKLEEYRRLHAQPWPGVLETLRAHHIANYSIFEHSGLLFSYFEYHGDDFAADMAAIAADPVTQEWWKLTDPCQRRLATAGDGEWWAQMEQVFLME